MALKSLRSSSAEPPLPPAVFSGQLFSRDGRTFDKKVANQFLEQYWQKSPCLIRKAFDFQSPLTADELAGLACEEDVMSRVIVNWENVADESAREGKKAWELRSGPFAEEFFATLPETCYTLLVQEVNKHVPELSELLDVFKFVPNWRMDDIMISYAAKGGGVGPHVDNYDVFLLQGKGQRRWAISYTPVPPEAEQIEPDVDVRVLQGGFKKDEEWVLEEGDVLYVPPRIPHWGVAEDDECMTYSIGFRAPNIQEVTSEFAVHLAEALDPDAFYEDKGRQVQASGSGQIADAEIETMWGHVKAGLVGGTEEEGRAAFAKWFGAFATEPLRGGVNDPERAIDPEEAAAILADLVSGAEPALFQAPGLRFAWLRTGATVTLSVNGELFEVRPGGADADANGASFCQQGAAILCGTSRISREALLPFVGEGSVLAPVVLELVEKGFLYCPSDGFEEEEEELEA